MMERTVGEGEQLEKQRRRRYWLVVAGLIASGMVVGFMFGFFGGYRDLPLDQALAEIPDGWVIALLAFAIASFTYGCWAFVRAIDEVELNDNLWGSTGSYYAYAVLFPSWWLLAKAGIASPPNHWLIFYVSLAAGLAVYFYRKWRAR